MCGDDLHGPLEKFNENAGAMKMNTNGKIFSLLLVAALCLTLASCATSQQKAETLAVDHPDWPPELIEEIAQGHVTVGMTSDMVAAAMGKRGDSSFDDKTGEEVWTYYRGYYDYQDGAVWVPVYFVFFKNDRVVRTEGNRNEVFTW